MKRSLLVCFFLLQPVLFSSYSFAAAPQAEWLILLYQDADDQTLERDIFIDFNEAELVGSSADVHIVSQIDRFKGGFDGDGDWTSTRRYYLKADNDLNKVSSPLIADLGERDMGNAASLVEFAVWAISNYPAKKVALIMSDHGEGWPGGWHDPDPAHSKIWLNELDQALGQIRKQSGIEKLELLGFDACLMGHLEVFAAIAPHARFGVASQELEPGIGWAYTPFLSQLQQNPGQDGAVLGKAIVDSYIVGDARIVDDRARRAFVRDLTGQNLDLPVEEIVAHQMQKGSLSAVRLERMEDVLAKGDAFIDAIAAVNPAQIAAARAYSQSFFSVFGKDLPPSYIDLGHFAALSAQQTGHPEVRRRSAALLDTIASSLVAEKHGPGLPGATGISIYFPNSALFASDGVPGFPTYVKVSDRFARMSKWDDFLLSFYTDATYQASTKPQKPPAAKPKPEPVVAQVPGKAELDILPIDFEEDPSGQTAGTLITDIAGDNIAFIYSFVGYYDAASNAVLTVDMDFVEGDQTENVNGVFFPVFDRNSQGSVEIDYQWQPLLYTMHDGKDAAFVLLEPEEYGASAEQAVYSVSGLYRFADTGEQRNAQIYFDSEGSMLGVLGYQQNQGVGAPREIYPLQGDQFTVLEEWMQLSPDSNDVAYFDVEGKTLTFGDRWFYIEEVEAPPGEYDVGFIVEDFDGNAYEEYTTIVLD